MLQKGLEISGQSLISITARQPMMVLPHVIYLPHMGHLKPLMVLINLEKK